MQLHSTKGIVLRQLKYGDTSLVVSIYTALFGIQSYLVQGVRSNTKSTHKANLYQIGNLLNLIVYHHPNKNLQRIKEAHLFYLYDDIYQVVIKNAIVFYMVELLSKTITEPESNADLYEFIENSFLHVEQSKEADLANYPIEFTFALASQLGFEVQNAYKENQNYFDLQNGNFCSQQELASTYFLQDADAVLLSQIIYSEPIATNLNQSKRNELLRYAIQYIQLHIPHVSDLKSVAVLHSMLS